MAELKTNPTGQSVLDYLNSISNPQTREDCFQLLDLMREAAQAEPKMWGSSIVGFGSYHYKGASGREGDWMLTGFSPRKKNLTIYIMTGFDAYEGLLKNLGRHSVAKSCLYIKRLADVDLSILESLIRQSVEHMRSSNP